MMQIGKTYLYLECGNTMALPTRKNANDKEKCIENLIFKVPESLVVKLLLVLVIHGQ